MRVSLLELSPASSAAAFTVSERGGAKFGPGEEDNEDVEVEEEEGFCSGACDFDAAAGD